MCSNNTACPFTCCRLSNLSRRVYRAQLVFEYSDAGCGIDGVENQHVAAATGETPAGDCDQGRLNECTAQGQGVGMALCFNGQVTAAAPAELYMAALDSPVGGAGGYQHDNGPEPPPVHAWPAQYSLSGTMLEFHNVDFVGVWLKTEQICHGAPVYKKARAWTHSSPMQPFGDHTSLPGYLYRRQRPAPAPGHSIFYWAISHGECMRSETPSPSLLSFLAHDMLVCAAGHLFDFVQNAVDCDSPVVNFDASGCAHELDPTNCATHWRECASPDGDCKAYELLGVEPRWANNPTITLADGAQSTGATSTRR